MRILVKGCRIFQKLDSVFIPVETTGWLYRMTPIWYMSSSLFAFHLTHSVLLYHSSLFQIPCTSGEVPNMSICEYQWTLYSLALLEFEKNSEFCNIIPIMQSKSVYDAIK